MRQRWTRTTDVPIFSICRYMFVCVCARTVQDTFLADRKREDILQGRRSLLENASPTMTAVAATSATAITEAATTTMTTTMAIAQRARCLLLIRIPFAFVIVLVFSHRLAEQKKHYFCYALFSLCALTLIHWIIMSCRDKAALCHLGWMYIRHFTIYSQQCCRRCCSENGKHFLCSTGLQTEDEGEHSASSGTTMFSLQT